LTEKPQARREGELVGGKYRLVRYLAAGGMGSVYEAQHTVVRRRFAIKLLRPELAAQRDSLSRFQREAEVAGTLENENVAAAIDFGIAEDGSPYIVMEYLAGESLRSLIDRGAKIPVSRACDIVMQACRGVGAAHKAGIIHRDINPQNLFLCRRDDGTDLVKVLDFGIAKLAAAESAETQTGAILGTPAYLSPEQARGERAIDHRTDVYGLGAVLYELLVDRKPHPGDSHNAILHHICTQPALPIDAAVVNLPRELAAVTTRVLASAPADRFASAEDFAQALSPYAKREVWPSTGEGEVPVTRTRPISTAEPPAPTRRPRIRHGELVALLALVGAVILAAGVFHRKDGKLPPRVVQRPFPADARFFVPPPNPGAVQQIAGLVKANASREAAAVTALAAVPQTVWFSKGTPEEVRGAVSNTVARATNDHSIPILAAFNRPYRDCAGFSLGGAKDTVAYEAWIDGFVAGIGNERAVVILEPDSIGFLPNNTSLDGTRDECKPTVTDDKGNTVMAPGATPEEYYAQFRYAVDHLRKAAPNALVYLDGAHANWLTVGETAYRLWKSGVLDAQGFAANVSNFRTTEHSVAYGTWISKCIYYATLLDSAKGTAAAFRRCANQPMRNEADNAAAWAETAAWYKEHVDAVTGGREASALPHFVIDTSRNGRGPLPIERYGKPPYNQPFSVLAGLSSGAWCNPPELGVGARPTTETGVPLVDAYVWIKTVGESDGSCDIAGGVRAWDYSQYNPWGLVGDGQRHFDPLWGMVNPTAGSWFPELALSLALNANPPLVP
jgi:endoglucanase